MSLSSLTMIEGEVSEEGTSRRVTSDQGSAIDQLTALCTTLAQQMGQMNTNVTHQMTQMNRGVTDRLSQMTEALSQTNNRMDKQIDALTLSMSTQMADLAKQLHTVHDGMDDLALRQWDTEDALSSVIMTEHNESRDRLVSKYPDRDDIGQSDPTWMPNPGVAKDATALPLRPPTSQCGMDSQSDWEASAGNAPVRRSARLLAKQGDRGKQGIGPRLTGLSPHEEEEEDDEPPRNMSDRAIPYQSEADIREKRLTPSWRSSGLATHGLDQHPPSKSPEGRPPKPHTPSLPRVTVPIRGGLGWVASPREVILNRFISVRLCLFHGRRMGNVLRMAVSQNRVRSSTSTSLSLCVYLLSYALPLPST